MRITGRKKKKQGKEKGSACAGRRRTAGRRCCTTGCVSCARVIRVLQINEIIILSIVRNIRTDIYIVIYIYVYTLRAAAAAAPGRCSVVRVRAHVIECYAAAHARTDGDRRRSTATQAVGGPPARPVARSFARKLPLIVTLARSAKREERIKKQINKRPVPYPTPGTV